MESAVLASAEDYRTQPEQGVAAFELPLVSVVVVNYNYAPFLERAVRSVIDQTYPNIQCIIVDDLSTDNSRETIKILQARFPRLKVILNERNVGQSASSVYALEQSEGDYIVFLDADDFLMPQCVEAHVITHLSLRDPIGFTSVDMMQIVGGRAVTTAFPCFSRHVRSAAPSHDHVRYFSLGLDVEAPIMTPDNIASLVVMVSPAEASGWPWSPTSGNCFRRDALFFITEGADLLALRSCTDSYLLRGVASLMGSALIDIPLVAYRVHQTNDFVRGTNLHRVMPYESDTLKKRSNQATMMLIDHFLANAAEISGRLEATAYYREALETLGRVEPPIRDHGLSYLDEGILLHQRELEKVMGPEEYRSWVGERLLHWRLAHFPVLGPLITKLVSSRARTKAIQARSVIKL